MRSSWILVAVMVVVIALASGNGAIAKGTFVPKAKCVACHVGTPSEKKFNEATQKMVKQYKTDECKNCHGPAEGDKPMTTTKKK